jgi:hypothetical protein
VIMKSLLIYQCASKIIKRKLHFFLRKQEKEILKLSLKLGYKLYLFVKHQCMKLLACQTSLLAAKLPRGQTLVLYSYSNCSNSQLLSDLNRRQNSHNDVL